MTALLALGTGMSMALGVLLTAAWFRPQHARLGDALAALNGLTSHEDEVSPSAGEGPGAWWLRHRRPPEHSGTSRDLMLAGRTRAAHYTHKLMTAVACVVGLILGGLLGVWGLWDAWVPLALVPVGAVLGFMAPTWLLRSSRPQLAADATEALLTYFDLVTLERLANQSATQSLHAAAGLSDAVVFGHIRTALERARLEQRMPYADLKQVGVQLGLPALGDLVDVMRLDETGASLSSTLRARVRELRDAHLTHEKEAAHRVSERMTLFMVAPAMIFGLIFLAPPVLRLLQG